MLGGMDARDAAQDDLRHGVCLGSQGAHLFAGTLRENLALARPVAARRELERALERAGLARGWPRCPKGGHDRR